MIDHQFLARVLEDYLNAACGRHVGFALLIFPFLNEGTGADYVSNGKREDMIKFLRETADRLESGQVTKHTEGTA
jgi:hypothetical protein